MIYDKKEFVSSYKNKETRKNIISNLAKINMFEKRANINKDMYFFNEEEWDIVLDKIKKEIKTIGSLASFVSMVDKYLSWAKTKPESQAEHNNINIKNLVKEKGIIKEVCDTELKPILTRNELYSLIEDKLQNEQDKMIVALIFEGVLGYEKQELRNLTINDIKGNILYLKNNDGTLIRELVVPEYTITILKRAINQTHHISKNGLGGGNSPLKPFKKTDYILKFVGKNKPYDKIPQVTLNQKISDVGDFLGIKNFSAANIAKSGMLDYLFLLEAKKGAELSSDDYKRVYIRFGEKTETNMGWSSKLKPLYEAYKLIYQIDQKLYERSTDFSLDGIYNQLTNMPLEVNIDGKEELDDEASNEGDFWDDGLPVFPKIPEPDKELGELGEQKVMDYLENKYPGKVKNVSDVQVFGYRGYDIELNNGKYIERIEVKSTRRVAPIYIHITYNEMKSALSYGDQYFLFIVIFEGINPVKAYNICNFLMSLEIDSVKIETMLDKSLLLEIEIYCQQFLLKINEKVIEPFIVSDFNIG